MGLQEYLRLLISTASLGVGLFSLPFLAAMLIDSVTRRLIIRRRRVAATVFSLIFSGIAAALIHPLATWPSLMDPSL